MKLVNITPEKLQNALPVLPYQENAPDAIAAAANVFGAIMPIFINKYSGKILNPVWMNAYSKLGLSEIPTAVLELPGDSEIGASIILNGGIEGWLYNVPADMQRVIPYLRTQYEKNRSALLALGAEPDYWHNFFRWLDNPESPPEPDLYTGMIDPDDMAIADFDIPLLDIEMQAALAADFSLTAWNSQPRKFGAYGWHFYVDDIRFAKVTKNPQILVDTGAKMAVEPNFSTADTQSLAEALYHIHKKRFMAGYWQKSGIKTIVDMNVSRRFLRLNLAGVPYGWGIYMNRAYTKDFEHLHAAHALALDHARGKPIMYLVLGGPAARKECDKHGWHWINAGKTLDGKGYS